MPRRRSVLLAPVVLCLAACGPWGGLRGEPSPPPTAELEELDVAVRAARDRLAAAEAALTERFGSLTWEDGDPERIAPADAVCAYASVVRRCDAYLGHDLGTTEEIAEVLTPVLEDHGFSALSVPTGGTGGWLSGSSERAGLEFTFRAKGHAEIGVSGQVQAQRCELPAPNDGD